MKLNRVLRHSRVGWPVRRKRGGSPVRLRTVPAGVALGGLLVTAIAFAGAIGIDPLPGFEPPTRSTGSAPGPRSALQPEIGATLLVPQDLPPGYVPAPSGPVSAGDRAAAADSSREDPGRGPADPPGAEPGDLLPSLPGLPVEGDALGIPIGGDPAPGADGTRWPRRRDRAERHPGGREGTTRPGDGRRDNDGGDNAHHRDSDRRPDNDGGDDHQRDSDRRRWHNDGGQQERPETTRGDARCRRLVAAPWALAAQGHPPAAAPRRVDHVDRAREMRVRQAVGAFAGDGAQRAVERIRTAAADCGEFRYGRLTVTVRPADLAEVGADESSVLRVSARRDGGRTWAGYLAVDRVGPVLSMLWHVGLEESGEGCAAEVAAARHAAVAKARPLAERLR